MSTYFSLIIPCYNEEEVITKAYNQITEDLKILNENGFIITETLSSDVPIEKIDNITLQNR